VVPASHEPCETGSSRGVATQEHGNRALALSVIGAGDPVLISLHDVASAPPQSLCNQITRTPG
jgi:hypothetical protein